MELVTGECHKQEAEMRYLSVIDVANGTNVDVRLITSEGSGIVPHAPSLLHRVDAPLVLERTARGAQESAGKGRHCLEQVCD